MKINDLNLVIRFDCVAGATCDIRLALVGNIAVSVVVLGVTRLRYFILPLL